MTRPIRVLASWRPPSDRTGCTWMPQLAPSHVLRRRWQSGVYSWRGFRDAYTAELREPSRQNALKPLALLDRRGALKLLCDCPDSRRCHHVLLAAAIRRCRSRKDFALSFARGNASRRRLP